jgi:DNA polymerase epsilon subunit 1
MKVNLLRMIHCKEFSNEVQGGVEPSLVLVIPDVICDNCQKCVDLDICRDPSLNADIENLVNQDDEDSKWRCSACSSSLNKLNIERRLLDLTNRRLISYQMQDLKCKQCHMVKNSIVSKYCDCTGAYLQTIGNQQPDKLRNQNLLNQMTDIKLFMQLIRNFASYHNFTILKDTTD